MRIATIGKGGSGKSTIGAGLVLDGARRGSHVVAIDADINRHLSLLLHINRTVADIGSRYQEVFQYCEGDRVDSSALPRIPEIGSIPPSATSRKIAVDPNDQFLKLFATQSDDISLLTAGTYEEADIGMTCIHVKLKALELALHRFADGPQDLVVIDATAGTDPLSTTLAYAYDLHLVIVEATRKSVRVFQDYFDAAVPVRDNIFALGNKISSADDIAFLKDMIGSEKLIGCIPEHELLHAFNRGQHAEFDRFVEAESDLWGRLRAKAVECSSNRPQRLANVGTVFKKACGSWFNDYYGFKVDEFFAAQQGAV